MDLVEDGRWQWIYLERHKSVACGARKKKGGGKNKGWERAIKSHNCLAPTVSFPITNQSLGIIGRVLEDPTYALVSRYPQTLWAQVALVTQVAHHWALVLNYQFG